MKHTVTKETNVETNSGVPWWIRLLMTRLAPQQPATTDDGPNEAKSKRRTGNTTTNISSATSANTGTSTTISTHREIPQQRVPDNGIVLAVAESTPVNVNDINLSLFTRHDVYHLSRCADLWCNTLIT